jgi:hypothetical protein
MNRETRPETRDERLRSLLRETDPAASDPGLSLDEVREMRRTVLTAMPERRRRFLPAFAAAGAVLVAALLVIVILFPRPNPGKAPAPPQVAALPDRTAPPKAVQTSPQPREEPRLRAEERKEERKKTTVRRKRRIPTSPIPVPVEQEAVVAEAAGQQIQFSTPGGTRIIWVLTSDKTLN